MSHTWTHQIEGYPRLSAEFNLTSITFGNKMKYIFWNIDVDIMELDNGNVVDQTFSLTGDARFGSFDALFNDVLDQFDQWRVIFQLSNCLRLIGIDFRCKISSLIWCYFAGSANYPQTVLRSNDSRTSLQVNSLLFWWCDMWHYTVRSRVFPHLYLQIRAKLTVVIFLAIGCKRFAGSRFTCLIFLINDPLNPRFHTDDFLSCIQFSWF